MTRLDLRLSPPLNKRTRLGAGGGSLSPQHFETMAVDWLERLRPLKSGVVCRINLARTLDRTLAVQVSAVALEAEGSRRGGPLLAGWAANSRASAFQFATRKANPLFINTFQPTIRQGFARN